MDLYTTRIPTSQKMIIINNINRDKTINEKLYNAKELELEGEKKSKNNSSLVFYESKLTYEERILKNNNLKDAILNTAKEKPEWLEVPKNYMKKGYLSEEEYNEVTIIYENNQQFLKYLLENYITSKRKILQSLINLEYWYVNLTLKKPYSRSVENLEEWKMPIKHKIRKGYSINCDKELIKYINKEENIDEKILNDLKRII